MTIMNFVVPDFPLRFASNWIGAGIAVLVTLGIYFANAGEAYISVLCISAGITLAAFRWRFKRRRQREYTPPGR